MHKCTLDEKLAISIYEKARKRYIESEKKKNGNQSFFFKFILQRYLAAFGKIKIQHALNIRLIISDFLLNINALNFNSRDLTAICLFETIVWPISFGVWVWRNGTLNGIHNDVISDLEKRWLKPMSIENMGNRNTILSHYQFFFAFSDESRSLFHFCLPFR